MKECSKSIPRRLADPNFVTKYFRGDGVDIGGLPDPLGLYRSLFPLMRSVRTWDITDGDAQHMAGVNDESYDFVHSSHCLEHLVDPREGLRNWFRILRPNGYLVVTVPDEDIYEQGIFPSTYNLDHKWTFTIVKQRSWSPKSINVVDLARSLGDAADVVRITLLDSTYRYDLPRYDQTQTPIGECAIEFVVRKRPAAEVETLGRRPGDTDPPGEVRLHLNQYRDDTSTLKAANRTRPPFKNDSRLAWNRPTSAEEGASNPAERPRGEKPRP